ncbi:TPA: hypothetical protein NI618_001663 [Pseudomonas aeruginosa]|nr:hypothetical protein [Pseudomonas aeruginosa]MCV4061382.1 hypothetical protein [Pseudomonas aeruginosa]MCV4079611.1 hypothetical protein [Pseudomonas aeruginosa]MCV4148796.1 hypothetical protein [Pseudomonas aeruginosa]MCV4180401.1 hypothetical protein [Pseudomonas aeruginosa]MCV4219864.1 hypothetical protein [Pseudomonas aeruginosa]
MIRADDSVQLALALVKAAKAALTRITFRVDPAGMTAQQIPTRATPAPLLIAHGNETELAGLIHSFHQWDDLVQIDLIHSDGLSHFWIEDV